MILVVSSIWVDHRAARLPNCRRAPALRQPQLTAALQESAVLIHPWVIGELACGNLRDLSRVLELLQCLKAAYVANKPSESSETDRAAPVDAARHLLCLFPAARFSKTYKLHPLDAGP